MKLKLTLATAMMLVASAANAATVPLSAAYGSPAGCAVHAETADPGGEKVYISKDDMRFEGNTCPYTKVTEAGDKAWTVEIACESGHEEVVRGTLGFTEAPDASKLTVALNSGEGPKGDYVPCDAAAK